MYSKNIEAFLIDNGLFEVYNLLNGIELVKRDNMHIEGTKCIDFVAVSNSLVEFIDACELINFNQFIEIDYRGYLVDINLELYFEFDYFDIDKVISSQLNSRRLSHWEKFCEKLEAYIESTNLQNIIDQQCHIKASNEILEMID